VGIMIRSSLNANSARKSAFMFSGGAIANQGQRLSDGAAPSSSPFGSGLSVPIWLRLVRTGTVVSTSYSTNGTTWLTLGANTTLSNLGTTAYVGMYVCSNTAASGNPAYARFDNVTLEATPATPATLTAVPGALPGEIKLNWPAVTAANSYGIERSTPNGSSFVALTTVTGVATYTDAGLIPNQTYYYRVKAININPAMQSGFSPTASSMPYFSAGTLAGWRYQTFGTNDTTGNSGDQADPDGDGLPNLMEYATQRSALAADTGGLPVPQTRSVSGINYLTLTFERVPSITDIDLRVETTDNLTGTWESFDPLLATHQVSVLNDSPSAGRQTITVRDTQPLSPGPRRFMRLRYRWKDTSLLARWQFDEPVTGSQTMAWDSTTNYNDLEMRSADTSANLHTTGTGTDTGPSGMPGDRSFYAAPGASSGNGRLPNPQSEAAWQNLGAFTFSCWVKLDSLPGGSSERLMEWTGAEPIQLWFPSAGALRLSVLPTGSSTNLDFGGGAILTSADIGKWVFIAVTYTGGQSADGVKFYRGTPTDAAVLFSQVGNTVTTGNIQNTGAGHFFLGNISAFNHRMPAKLDDVRFYSAARTDINAIRQSGLVPASQ